jgi:hypothetical protein
MPDFVDQPLNIVLVLNAEPFCHALHRALRLIQSAGGCVAANDLPGSVSGKQNLVPSLQAKKIPDIHRHRHLTIDR